MHSYILLDLSLLKKKHNCFVQCNFKLLDFKYNHYIYIYNIEIQNKITSTVFAVNSNK